MYANAGPPGSTTVAANDDIDGSVLYRQEIPGASSGAMTQRCFPVIEHRFLPAHRAPANRKNGSQPTAFRREGAVADRVYASMDAM
jgi:hypothetical protein